MSTQPGDEPTSADHPTMAQNSLAGAESWTQGPAELDPEPVPVPALDSNDLDILIHEIGKIAGSQMFDGHRPAVPLLEWVDRYQIERYVGSGGFGHVFRAIDTKTGHPVAIKIPREDRLQTKWTDQEFRAGQRIHHPHVVAVLYAGEFEGLPYLLSEFIEGPSLATWLKERGRENLLPVRAAASLVALLADGVQCCHASGVIHRDLKPGNVLLQTDAKFGQTIEGLPEPLVPRITDFGLSRSAQRTLDSSTHPLGRAGTLAYMAPEQAEERADQNEAVDLHALGVILYELLSGSLPYQGESDHEIMDRLRHSEPRSPRLLRPRLPRDLETICLKCLHKEPGKRYPSAASLQADLQAFLDGRPISARPVSRLEKTARRVKRKPTEAILSAVSALATLGLITGSLFYNYKLAEDNKTIHEQAKAIREQDGVLRAQDEAIRKQNQALLKSVVTSRVNEAHQWEAEGQLDRASEVLFALYRELTAGIDPGFIFRALWHQIDRRISFLWTDHKHLNAFSLLNTPAGPRLALGELLTHSLSVWDPIARQQIAHTTNNWGKIQACPGNPPRLFVFPELKKPADPAAPVTNAVQVLDLETLQLKNSFPLPDWYQDDLFMAPMSENRLLLVDKHTSQCEIRDQGTFEVLHRLQLNGICRAVGVSPDGNRLAMTVANQAGELWLDVWDNAGNGYQSRRIAGPFQAPRPMSDCVFHPDGEHVLFLTGGPDGAIRVADLKSGTTSALVARPIPTPRDEFCLSPNGRLLANSQKNGGIEIRNAQTGELIQELKTTSFFIKDLAFSADNQTLYSITSEDPRVWIWHLDEQGKLLTNGDRTFDLAAQLAGRYKEPVELNCVTFSPDSSLIAFGCEPSGIWVAPKEHIRDGTLLRLGDEGVTSIVYLDGGRKLAAGDWGQPSQIRIVDLATGLVEHSLGGHERAVHDLALSPDGKTLASASRDGTVRLWDLTHPDQPGRIIKRVNESNQVPGVSGDDARCLAFSPDGNFLAMGDNLFQRTVYDLTLERVVYNEPGSRSVQAVAFSPKGDLIAFGDGMGTITLVAWPSQETRVIRAHEAFCGVLSLAFHPDGNELASGGDGGSVAVWNVSDGRALLRDESHTGEVRGLAFSPDGNTLASVDQHGVVRMIEAPKPVFPGTNPAIEPEPAPRP